jgi:carboxyl-terminal processing protease
MRFVVGLVVLAACGSAAAPPPAKLAPVAESGQAASSAPRSGQAAPSAPTGQASLQQATVAPAEPTPADPRVAADLKSFDVVWQRVAELFYDPAYGGVDWKTVRTELRPKILQTRTREEARAIMNEALARLGKSHFGVSGPLEEEGPEAGDGKGGPAGSSKSGPAGDGKSGPGGGGGGEAGVGIDVRVLGGAVIVTRIERGSPAEQAKLPLGAELVAVDGIELAPRLAAIAEKLGASSLLPLYQARSVHRLIDGRAGTKVALGLRAGGKVTALAVERAQAGQATTLGNLGTHRVVYEARKLDGRTGYIRLSMFLDPAAIVPAFAKDLGAFKDTAGVIIDLRGNPGGLGGMAMGMAGHLISDEHKKLGTMRTRETSLDFVVNPQVQRYAGKVAVLVDELSASTSEIFAGGLQDLGRARVFGRRTPGAALPSTIEQLPNGDRFQYAIADYVSAGGKVLEGNGVLPDVPVALDVKALRAGKDPDIVAATRWIKEQP